MCGICGIVGENINTSKNELIVRAMMKTLIHRGPDDCGIEKGKNFIFGHQRLSIIDINHGHQPMLTDDKQVVLVLNGEIYNYLELKRELSLKGVKFKTTSDTEVLLKLYEQKGPKCLEYINGMFSFAIFDSRKKIFFAARDQFGIKPFYYYAFPNGNIVFASEIKAILQHPRIRAEVNYDGLEEYLTFQFCFNNKTLFKGIKKLEPAHKINWFLSDGDKFQIQEYWKQNYKVDTRHSKAYSIDRLKFLLEDSIQLQLRSDVSLGAYLSGGIDSSVVASLAGRLYGNDFQCFTGKFKEGILFDESKYAKVVAKNINTKLHFVTIEENGFIRLMPKLIYCMDEPVAGPGLLPQYVVSSFAAQHVKVVLGGHGGDEIFGGYTRYAIAYLEQCIKGAIYESQEEGRHIVTLNSIIKNLPALKEYVPMLKEFWKTGLFESMDSRYFKLIDRGGDLKSVLSKEMQSLHSKEKMFEHFASVFNSAGTKSYINKMLHFDQKTLLPALMHIEDRVSMAASLESRVPLLDYRIVEFANTLPPALKFHGGRLKHILREAMKNVLPSLILDRRDKMGFPVPLKEWLKKGPVCDFVRSIILSDSARKRGLFNVKEVEKLLEKEGNYVRQIWGILCLELWHQIFIDKNSAYSFLHKGNL
ncbi:MAG: asparagine synthase (glutamine-hydrolyzing) [Candidatus Omnitrophota bacterium]